MEEELPLPQEGAEVISPLQRTGASGKGASALRLRALQKEKQDPEFDVKVAATGGSDRTASTAICADSVPANSHASHRNHLT